MPRNAVSRRTRMLLESRDPAASAADVFGCPEMTTVQRYLQLDCREICAAVRQQLAKKKGARDAEEQDMLSVFEGGTDADRMRGLIMEVLSEMSRPDEAESTMVLLHTGFLQDELLCALTVAMARCPEALPPGAVTRVLLQSPLCPALVEAIVDNDPTAFDEVVEVLVGTSKSKMSTFASEALIAIATMSKRSARKVRTALVAASAQPEHVLELTLSVIKDPVDFLGSQAAKGRSWFWEHLEKQCKQPSVREAYAGDTASRSWAHQLIDMLISTAEAAVQGDTTKGSTAAVLRVLNTLGGLSGIVLAPTEARRCLQVIKAAAGEREAELGLAFLVVSAGLHNTVERADILETWKAVEELGASEGALLAATLLLTEQLERLVEVVHGLLGFPAALQRDHIKELRATIQPHLDAAPIAAAVLALHPTPSFGAGQASHSVGCFRQLLRSRPLLSAAAALEKEQGETAFAADVPTGRQALTLRRGYSASATQRRPTWLMAQLLEAAPPVHAQLLRLIDDYVAAGADSLVPRVSEKVVREVFMPTQDGETVRVVGRVPQALVLYYVLAHNAAVTALPSSGQHRRTPAQAPFSLDLIDALPLKSLLSHAHAHPKVFGSIYPALLSLVVSQVPAIFCVQSLLLEEELLGRSRGTGGLSCTTLPAAVFGMSAIHIPELEQLSEEPQLGLIEEFLRSGDTDQQVVACLALSHLQPAAQHAAAEPFVMAIVAHICQPHEAGPDQRLCTLFPVIWESMFIEAPFELALVLVNALQQDGTVLSHRDVVRNPLLTLEAKDSALASPPVLRCLLQALSLYMNSSKSHLSSAVAENLPAKLEEREAKHEELAAIVLTQDSAAIQLLLELCLEPASPPSAWQGGGGHAALEETRLLICEFVHELFIEHPLLIKLVHFQGYEPSLLAMCAQGIPSMHLCLDFLPELLQQPQPRQCAFGVLLAGVLISQYPLPTSLPVAHQVLGILSSIKENSPLEPYVAELLPSLEAICCAFPVLTPDAVHTLMLLKQRLHGSEASDRVVAPQSRGAAPDIMQVTFQSIVRDHVLSVSRPPPDSIPLVGSF